MNDSETHDSEMYSTTDFYITAVLIATGYEVLHMSQEGPNGRVKRFHFADTEELKDTIRQYLNNKLTGSYRKFKDSIEAVKEMIYSN